MPRAGEPFGPYVLVRRLGAGGFGEVWLAEKNVAEASAVFRYAVKIALDEEADPEAFRKEVKTWVAACGHPNILPVVDAGIWDGIPAIVTEYAPEGSLGDWMKARGAEAPDYAAAAEMTAGILEGLIHLHERQILHRDLKPANILLQGGKPRIADFGLARVFTSSRKKSSVSGTPVYMAPEAFDGDRSEQTDLWSVGVILYQLAEGRLPYPQRTPTEILKAMLTRDPDPLSPRTPGRLREIIGKALRKDPRERYRTAGEMLHDLKRAREESRGIQPEADGGMLPPPSPPHPSPHPRTDPERPLVTEQYAPTIPQTVSETLRLREDETRRKEATRISRRNGWLWIGLLVAAVVGASIWAAIKFSQPTPPDQPPVAVPAATAEGPAPTVVNGPAGMRFAAIPGGSFTMGSINGEANEAPPHQVTVAPFQLMTTEVTQGMWKTVMGTVPWKDKISIQEGDDYPAVYVSWNDAQDFIRQLDQQTGQAFRLPSEAEWEYACRAGKTGKFCFGDDEGKLDAYCWYMANTWNMYEHWAHRVAMKKPNAWGLYDMHGNVWEWCQDTYQDDYLGAPADGSAWVTPGIASMVKPVAPGRVNRGGSWFCNAESCRSARRDKNIPEFQSYTLGFRLARVQP